MLKKFKTTHLVDFKKSDRININTITSKIEKCTYEELLKIIEVCETSLLKTKKAIQRFDCFTQDEAVFLLRYCQTDSFQENSGKQRQYTLRLLVDDLRIPKAGPHGENAELFYAVALARYKQATCTVSQFKFPKDFVSCEHTKNLESDKPIPLDPVCRIDIKQILNRVLKPYPDRGIDLFYVTSDRTKIVVQCFQIKHTRDKLSFISEKNNPFAFQTIAKKLESHAKKLKKIFSCLFIDFDAENTPLPFEWKLNLIATSCDMSNPVWHKIRLHSYDEEKVKCYEEAMKMIDEIQFWDRDELKLMTQPFKKIFEGKFHAFRRIMTDTILPPSVLKLMK